MFFSYLLRTFYKLNFIIPADNKLSVNNKYFHHARNNRFKIFNRKLKSLAKQIMYIKEEMYILYLLFRPDLHLCQTLTNPTKGVPINIALRLVTLVHIQRRTPHRLENGNLTKILATKRYRYYAIGGSKSGPRWLFLG